jgi:UDP:flavonoid glycosyltransferase YjiC (YdhE family)
LELRARGHQVTIATSAVYRSKVEGEGLHFHAVRPDISLQDEEMLAYTYDRKMGSERIVRAFAETTPDSYEDTLPAVKQADAVVTHMCTFGAAMAAQKLGVLWISTILAPSSILSAHDPSSPSPAPWAAKLRVLGVDFMRNFWEAARKQTLAWVQPLIEFRKELGLPPNGHPLFEGANSPTLVLAMFSRHLAQPQPDWPPQTVVTGFPFYDRDPGHVDLSPELEGFLSEGPPPVVFTLGSITVGMAGDFYMQSLEAVERLGCRAVLLTGPRPQALPNVLPPGVITTGYAPHSAIFPRASATVHQGGVGTLAQSMRAGKTMLVVPFAHDQFDNGYRLQRLGSAEVLARERYSAARAESHLRRLLNEPSYAAAAMEIGEKIRAENGTATAADAIERVL